MKIRISIPIYELDGENVAIDSPYLLVESHWNYDKLVVIGIGNIKYTIDGKTLIDAVQRSMNWRWGRKG